MTRPVICRYVVTVVRSELSSRLTRQSRKGSLPFSSTSLYVSVFFVEVVVECVDFVVSYGGESIVNVA